MLTMENWGCVPYLKGADIPQPLPNVAMQVLRPTLPDPLTFLKEEADYFM
jgi:hypothetical protein